MRILVALPCAVSACTGPTAPTDKGADTDTGTPTTFTLSPTLVLEDRGNYTFDQSWVMSSSEIKANAAEVFLSWDAKTTDAWDVTRDADSYGVLTLMTLSCSRTDAVERLADDDLASAVTASWRANVQGTTDAALSDLAGFDPTTQLVEDDAVSWLLALADDAGPRLDVRDGLFLIPKTAQPGITLSIPQAGAHTEWSVRFGPDEQRTDSGRDDYALDLSGLTTDAYGKPFDAARVDRVFVGRFDDVDEADDLGGDVLGLRAVASGFWTVDPAGTTNVDLMAAVDEGGSPFPGFTSDTAWLVGGECTTCLGPAPMFLTVVEVRDP